MIKSAGEGCQEAIGRQDDCLLLKVLVTSHCLIIRQVSDPFQGDLSKHVTFLSSLLSLTELTEGKIE